MKAASDVLEPKAALRMCQSGRKEIVASGPMNDFLLVPQSKEAARAKATGAALVAVRSVAF